MNLVTLTTVLAYISLVSVLAACCANGWLLFQSRQRAGALLSLALSALTGFGLIRVIMRLSAGLFCYRSPLSTLLLYGGITAVQLYLLWDAGRSLRLAAQNKEVH